MQGSYKDNGLPRPYYMKPSKKRSHYDNLPVNIINTPRRKLLGYLVLLTIFGLILYEVSQGIKSSGDLDVEIVSPKERNKNIDNFVNTVGSKADNEIENLALAGNVAQNSKGQIGRGVPEAPKGGIANEGFFVGNDEDKVVGNVNSKSGKVTTSSEKIKGEADSKRGDSNEKQKT